MTWSKKEFELKLARVRSLMEEQVINTIVIENQINFLWLTGGRPYVNISIPKACANLVITLDKVYLLSSNIEEQRLSVEELHSLPIEPVTYNWWEETARKDMLTELAQGKRVITDSQLGKTFSRLRWKLTAGEQDRYRKTGVCTSKILETVAYELKPGDTESDVAREIKQISLEYDFYPWVTLVGADERAYKYRHPLPTENSIKKYVLLAISGHKYGLMASATRLVHFGSVPEELSKRHQAVIQVDAAFIGATKSGARVKDIFKEGDKAYEKVGYGNEWHYHHQGGMAGYNSREFRATSDCNEIVTANQAYAWNPTIAGTKSEDTILVTEKGPEIITKPIKYPTVYGKYKGLNIPRPDILIR